MTTPANQAAMTVAEAADLILVEARWAHQLDRGTRWAEALRMAEAALRERGELEKDAARMDALEACNTGRSMWIVARGTDSFTVALKSPYGNCVTRKTLREAIDAALNPQPQGGERL